MAMKKKLPHPMKQGLPTTTPEFEGVAVQQMGRVYRLSKGESPVKSQVQALFGGKRPA